MRLSESCLSFSVLILVFAVIMLNSQEYLIPDPAKYLYNLGVDQLKIGNADSALSLFMGSARIDSTFPWVYVGIANALYLKGDLNRAIGANMRALELDSTLIEPAINLGKIYYELGNYPNSISWLKRIWARYPHIASVNLMIGQNYFFLEEDDSAEIYYRYAIKCAPNSPDPWISLGVLFRAQGKYDEALNAFHIAEGLDSTIALVRYNIACTYVLKGDKSRALDELKMAIKFDPHYIEISKTDTCFAPVREMKGFKKLWKAKK